MVVDNIERKDIERTPAVGGLNPSIVGVNGATLFDIDGAGCVDWGSAHTCIGRCSITEQGTAAAGRQQHSPGVRY